MIIRFHESFALPPDEVFSYFQSPSDWVRLYGFGGAVRDLGAGWYAVPLKWFPFPLVARMTAVEPSRLARWEFRGFWKGEGEVRFTASGGAVALEGFERVSLRWFPLISPLLETLFLERAFHAIWGLGWKRLHRAERIAADPAARFAPAPPVPQFIEKELPLTRRVWTIDEGIDAGKRLHFIDQGDPHSRPILMLHGNPTWSFLWRRVIALLPEFRCVAPDLLGLGLSDRLPSMGDHTPGRHADAIAALARALDLRGVTLVGQDWGGAILMSVAARIPDRVSGVVLANTAVLAPARGLRSRFHRFARVPLVSTLAFRGLGFPLNALHSVQGDPSSIRGDVAKGYRWPLRGWKRRLAPLALARAVPDGPDHPSVPELQRGEAWLRAFEGPLTFVWGMRDPILGRALARHEREFPRARVIRTEAGHFLQEEVPEVIAEEIRRLVDC